MTQDKILALFREKGFRATPQRIAVFNYVYEHRDHPDVLAIYENVLKTNPGFFKDHSLQCAEITLRKRLCYGNNNRRRQNSL